MFLEVFLVFKRIMFLGIRHGTAFEPAVQHFGNAGQHSAIFARQSDLVHEMLVNVGDLASGKFFQFLNGADTDRFPSIGVAPHRQRTAPVTVAADRPVAGIFQPFAETAFLDMFRDPVHLLVGGEHFRLDRFDADKPGGNRLVDQRGVVAPAMRITVLDRAAVDQFSFGFQTFHDRLVRIFHEHAFVFRNQRSEFAFRIDGADTGNAVGFAGDAVVFTEQRSGMNNTRTVFRADIIRVDDPVCAVGDEVKAFLDLLIFAAFDQVAAFGFFAEEVREERFVTHSQQIFAFAARRDFRHGVFLVICTETRFRQNVEIIAVLDFDIVNIRSGGKRHVGRQSPRGGSPRQNVGVLFADYFEPDGNGVVDNFLVALIGFEVGQRRGAAGAVRQNLVAFVDQSLIPEILEHVPDGFHVLGVHGAVSVAEIDPAAHAGYDGFPFGGVTENNGAAGLIEFGDAVIFDLFFAGKMKLFFHFIFNRQTVAVPAEGAVAVFAQHGLVTGNHVFNRTGEQMSVMRQSGGKRRAVVNDKLIFAFAVLP